MDKMELKALGKINLGLDVLGRRENGYHDVRMVMQTVYLYDQIRMEKTKKPGIELLTNLFYLPVNENNLAYQAADLLMKEFHVKEGVKITLDKHIPVAAGMAGGSSNAAAVLFGINRMFSLGLSQKELMERGVTLGADVPYCVMRGTVLAEGIGEILTPLPACPKCHVLIAKPPISVSTKLVYEKLDSHEIENHPDIDGIIDGLYDQDITKVASRMGNVLEKVTIEEYPVIEQIKNVMKEQGALNAMMSGSGPTVFGLYETKEKARKAAAKIREKQLAKQVYVTGIHNAVSRTPIREAIRKLELEGLVLMIPRKGAEVAEITEKNMRDVLEVRKALEELAVQLACEKITDEEIEEMKKAAEEFKMILKSKDITEIAEADVRFHDIIYMATDNQKLILLLNNLREQMYRYRVEYLKREEAYPQLIAEHAAIIEYISKGEKKAATDVMCKHIDNQVTTVIDVIRTKQN